MGVIITRNQPQGRIAIDWGNPITRGLAFALVHLQGNAAGWSRGAPNRPYDSAIDVVTPIGRAAKATTISSQLYDTGQIGITGSDYGLFAYGTLSSASAIQSAIDDDLDTASPRCFQFRLNSGKTELITFDTGASPYFATAAALSADQLAAGVAMGAAVSGNNIAVFQNGIKTAATASGTQRVPSGDFRIGQHKGAGGAGWATGGLALVMGWSRTPTDAEMRSLAENPWQLFRAPERRILVASGAPAGTDTPVNPGAGSVAFTGYAPSIAQSANQSAAPGAGSLGVTGYAPTITQPQAVAANVGSLAITGYAPTVTQAINQAVNPSAGTLAFTGYAPSVAQSANQAAAPGAGSVALTGYAPSVAQSAHQGVTPDAGSLTVTGYAPSVVQESASRSVLPAVGTLSIAGYAPTIEQTGAGGGADYGSSKKKRRRVLIGNKTYVVNDAELKRLLEMELLSDDAPEPAKQPPVDPKPLPDPEVAPVVIEAPKPVKPMEFAPVESIEQTQKFKRLMSGLQKQQDERAQMILRQIAEEIEEEDIEFLLLMG
jgi:hypothetical protein